MLPLAALLALTLACGPAQAKDKLGGSLAVEDNKKSVLDEVGNPSRTTFRGEGARKLNTWTQPAPATGGDKDPFSGVTGGAKGEQATGLEDQASAMLRSALEGATKITENALRPETTKNLGDRFGVPLTKALLRERPHASNEAVVPLSTADLAPLKNEPQATRIAVITRLAVNGHVAAAAQLAEEEVRTDPTHAPAWSARSAAALAGGDARRGAEDARKALALDPQDKLAKELLRFAETRLAVQEGGGRRAADAAKRAGERLKALSADPGEGLDGPVGRPDGLAAARRSEETGAAPEEGAAAAALQRGISDAGKSLVREADAARKLGELPKAQALLERALALNPRHCDALNLRAEVNLKLKRYGISAQDAATSLGHCPDNVPALNARSLAFSRLRQFPPALADAERAAQLAPRSPFAYLARAEAREGLGDLRAMARDLRRAAALDRRYLPRYEAKLHEYDLPIEPVTMDSDPSLFEDSPRPAGARSAPSAAHGRAGTLLVWALAILAGGSLIALGLVLARQDRKTASRKLAEAAEGAAAPPPAAARAAAVGEDGVRLAAPFVLKKPIGRGGMGVVYEAWDVSLERRVAIKRMREELSQDPLERERFIKEARLVADLVHPSIVSIHSIFEEDGELYLVFEYVDGKTLDGHLHDKGRLDLAETRRLLLPVCEALDFAHARGVVHRDLKPSNVMLAGSGKPKVMDFGIARAAKDRLARMSMTNTVAGTPLYMPPEAERGMVSAAWDVYSLGALAYELLAGRPPYPGAASAIAKLNRAYERLGAVDAALGGEADEAIHAALDPDPDRRPKGAMRFWEALAGKATPPRSKVAA